MRLVEGVFREGLPVLPYLLESVLGIAVRERSAHERLLQRVEHRLLLLSHGLAELVRLALGESGQLLREQHHLLLVDRDAVGFLEILLHVRKVVSDGARVVLAGYELGDVVHWAGPVEGVHGNQILETLRTQLHEPFLHSSGFELEHALGVSPRIELVDLGVVYRNLLYVYVHAEALLHERRAAGYDGQGLEPEEIHLEHAHVLDFGALILAHPHFLPCRLVYSGGDRDVVGEIAAAYYHRAGVDSHLAYAAFELQREFQDLAHERLPVLVFFPELLDVFHAVGQGRLLLHVLAVLLDDYRLVGNHLGQAV